MSACVQENREYGKGTSKEKKKELLRLKKGGENCETAARILGVSICTIRSLCKSNHVDGAGVPMKKRRGCPNSSASSLLTKQTAIWFVPESEDRHQADTELLVRKLNSRRVHLQALSAINKDVRAIKFTTSLGSLKKEDHDAWNASVTRATEEKRLEKSNQIIVLVNAISHGKLKSRLQAEVNYGVFFLRSSPYSLVPNSIELTWSMMKVYIKRKVSANASALSEGIPNTTIAESRR
eukprot:augustus_masked-scaffold_84-processed-gene-0.35-mRNA-1 protein AED:1.00 eAED:1.00 QI:0/0/0/0/1/1/2/0/236